MEYEEDEDNEMFPKESYTLNLGKPLLESGDFAVGTRLSDGVEIIVIECNDGVMDVIPLENAKKDGILPELIKEYEERKKS